VTEATTATAATGHHQPVWGVLTSRRAFLAGTLAAAGLALLDPGQLAAARRRAASRPDGELFGLGVASGDPTSSSVICWTRLLAPAGGDSLPDADVAVDWAMATDEAFGNVVASGTAPAIAALGHSVHVDVTGLEADRWYWYRFSVDGRTSPGGRTRTFPGAGETPKRVHFALATCQNWADGFYTAHAGIAAEDIDLVVFVGDYIYETSADRPPRPLSLPESLDVASYRARYELYKSDPNLQASHQRAPWIVTVDDHEVANNMLGDFGKYGEDEGDPAAIAAFLERRADAYQVWYEHQPLRLPPPTGSGYELYRVVEHSELLRFYVLDGRQYCSTYPARAPRAPTPLSASPGARPCSVTPRRTGSTGSSRHRRRAGTSSPNRR
jgi:alkaline phosphatase D